MTQQTTSRDRKILAGVTLAMFVAMFAGFTACDTGSNTAASPDVSPTATTAVATWFADGGRDRMSAISADLTSIGAAGQASDPVAMNAACGSLQTHVEAAQAYDAVPDATAQADWSASLAQTARAATDCTAGTSTLNADLLIKTTQEISAGTASLTAMNTRLRELG